MLSQGWKKLSDRGYGYLLESVKISVSPITNVIKNRSQLYLQEDLFPRVKNRYVASSTSIEKQGSLEIGQAPKVEFQLKESNNTTVTSDEWHLETWGSSTTGDYWMYKQMSNAKYLSFTPGLHISKWIIVSEKMCGFGVTIEQVLRFNFTTIGTLKKTVRPKLKLVKCPKIVHVLEMNFNNLEDFNEKFTTLDEFHFGVEDLIIAVNNDNITDKTTKTNSGIINIERSIINEKSIIISM